MVPPFSACWYVLPELKIRVVAVLLMAPKFCTKPPDPTEMDPPEKLRDPWVMSMPVRPTAVLFVTVWVLRMVMLVPAPPAGGVLAVTHAVPFQICQVAAVFQLPVAALR